MQCIHGAAVSCSPDTPQLSRARLGFWLTGKLGHAWVGAWVHGWMMWGGGGLVMMWGGE